MGGGSRRAFSAHFTQAGNLPQQGCSLRGEGRAEVLAGAPLTVHGPQSQEMPPSECLRPPAHPSSPICGDTASPWGLNPPQLEAHTDRLSFLALCLRLARAPALST